MKLKPGLSIPCKEVIFMPKEKSSHLNEVIEAIALLKNFERDWPGGARNRLLKEALERIQTGLQEDLFQIMSQKKTGRKGSERSNS
jgi:hypothetical protein